MTSMKPFLLFQGGRAEEALRFYVETIPGSRIDALERFGPEGPGPEGTVLRATVTIALTNSPRVPNLSGFTIPFEGSVFPGCASASCGSTNTPPTSKTATRSVRTASAVRCAFIV